MEFFACVSTIVAFLCQPVMDALQNCLQAAAGDLFTSARDSVPGAINSRFFPRSSPADEDSAVRGRDMECSKVFGNPITNTTLKGMAEYVGKTIRREDRAHVALDLKNTLDREIEAGHYVEKLKARSGAEISTLCLAYNATGDPITIVTSHDWDGHVGPVPYPVELANGQLGVFLHMKTTGRASAGGVVYRGKDGLGDDCDWMVGWYNRGDPSLSNRVYCEAREREHYITSAWEVIWGYLENSCATQHRDEWRGCLSMASIGSGTSPIFEATLTLIDAVSPAVIS